jgi:hypothetical protein
VNVVISNKPPSTSTVLRNLKIVIIGKLEITALTDVLFFNVKPLPSLVFLLDIGFSEELVSEEIVESGLELQMGLQVRDMLSVGVIQFKSHQPRILRQHFEVVNYTRLFGFHRMNHTPGNNSDVRWEVFGDVLVRWIKK